VTGLGQDEPATAFGNATMCRPASFSMRRFSQKHTFFLEQRVPVTFIRGRTEGKVTSMTGPRSGIYLSLHSLEFRDVAVTVRPPDRFIQLMARIGRSLGYKL